MNLTLNQSIAISEDMYKKLPNSQKDPPYPVRDVYIISNSKTVSINAGCNRTHVLSCTDEFLDIPNPPEKQSFIIMDLSLYSTVLEKHESNIDYILVVTVDEPYNTATSWQAPNVLTWQPSPTLRYPGNRHYPGYSITKYRQEPVGF